MDRGSASVFSGARASYVALSCTAMLVLSLLAGAWVPDASGAVAVLGLLAVYIGSTECLVLFYSIAPLAALIDLCRLGGPRELHRRGWLILFQLLGIAAKAAGALFAWSLHRSAVSGEAAGGGAAYGLGGGGGGGPAPPPPLSGYTRVDDPFASASVASYAPHPPPQPQPQPQPPPVQQQAPAPAQPPAQAAAPAPPAPELL